jgi:hypothetical protein
VAEIMLFAPKHERDARQNLADFIEMCRDRLTVFGHELDWYSDAWPKVGNFTVMGAPARGYTTEQVLDSNFLPFAKAYVRYQQGLNPTKLKNEFKALRCIEPALLSVKGKADITLVDSVVIDVAAQIARKYQTTAYQAGAALTKLIRFLNESLIIPSRIEWRNPISKPAEINRTDAETREKRSEKLPQNHQLEAMAEMFSNDLQEPRDRFTTSIFGLLMCAPSRISEVQTLPLQVLHEDRDSEGINRLGLRFFAGKGGGWDIKYVPSFFEDVAKDAVRRLVELSSEGRKLAKWYEENPSRFYRHDDCPDVSETAPLSSEQVCLALGLLWAGNKGLIDAYFKNYAPYAARKLANEPLTLAFLNEYCRSELPGTFPWYDGDRRLKYSEMLCCYRCHEFRSDISTSRVKLWTPGKSLFTTDLNQIPGQERSIWIRHGYKNPNGSDISMTSHQMRHLLNTAAQRGNLGQLDIAKWSGRANIHQNAVYNHVTEKERTKLTERALPSGLPQKSETKAPVTLADIGAAGDSIAHVTVFGYCGHDFSMLPCQIHRDCLNCSEHVCVKGDAIKLKNIKTQRDVTVIQLEKAKAAQSAGYDGADRWSQHQIEALKRIDQIIHILESPEVPDGSVIRQNNDREFSPLQREIAARKSLPRLASEPKEPEPEPEPEPKPKPKPETF